jgi:tetrahydromethanopterin S-methyltransferase subunit G
MANGKSPKTTGEHLVALYGHVTGLKKDINVIKTNHLKHIHEDLDEVHKKVEKTSSKIDKLLYLLIAGLLAAVLAIFNSAGN